MMHALLLLSPVRYTQITNQVHPRTLHISLALRVCSFDAFFVEYDGKYKNAETDGIEWIHLLSNLK